MIPWGYLIAFVYLACGALTVLVQYLAREWLLDFIERINAMEPGFRTNVFESGARFGNSPQEAEFKVDILLFFGWPIFVVVYTIMYLAVRKFERYQDRMDYLDEKAEQLREARNLVEDTPEAKASKEEIVWAAEMNLKGAQDAMRPPWYDRLYWRIRYGKPTYVSDVPSIANIGMGAAIFDATGAEIGREATVASHGCPEHPHAVLTCPECRTLPEVQKVVDELKKSGVLASGDGT